GRCVGGHGAMVLLTAGRRGRLAGLISAGSRRPGAVAVDERTARSRLRRELGLDRGLAVAEGWIAQLDSELLLEPGVADPPVAVGEPRLAGLDDLARRRQREAEAVA